MADVRDILGVPRGQAADRQEGPKTKEKVQRPAGMSREAFALLGGSHPIVPSQLTEELRKKEDLKGLKQKRKNAKGQVTWRWQPFTNPARMDSLALGHWVKCYKDQHGNTRPAEEGEYSFAKFNKKAQVYRYDDEEWQNVVARDADWDRAETDYLLSLSEQYDLRFLVIADRYEYSGGKPRTCEDLKERYYKVARSLQVAWEGSEEGAANLTLVKHPFNAQHERDRKKAIEVLLARTAQQDAEENVVLEKASVVEEARRKEAALRKAASQPARPAPVVATGAGATGIGGTPSSSAAGMSSVEIPAAVPDVMEAGTCSLLDADVAPHWPPKTGVYIRGAFTRQMGQQQLTRMGGGARAQKSVETALADLNMTNTPDMPTRETCGAWLALRKEIIELQDLKRKVQGRADGAGSVGPEGRGKRSHKGKAPSRYDES